MKRAALALLLLAGCSGGTLRLTAPLTIVALAPGSGSTASPSVTPQVTFSDPVEPSAIAAIRLAGAGGDLTATVTLSQDGRTASLLPAAPLASGSYDLTVGADVRRASDGARLGTDVVSHFTVRAAAFSVVAVFPTAGSRDADPSGELRAVFSAPLDCASARADADGDGLPDGLDVRAGGDPVCTIAEVTCEGSSLTCQPASPFAAGAHVDASIPASLKSADGAVLGAPAPWSFDVAGDAARPLYVISAEPAGESVGVPRQAVVTVGFNLPLDEDRLRQATTAGFPDYFVVADAGTGTPIAGALISAPAGGGESVTFTPTTPFASGSTISVSIDTGLRAAAASGGAALAAPYAFRFRVADAATYSVILSPADGAQGVVPASELLAVFTRPPDPATVVTSGAGATVSLAAPGGQDAGPLTCRVGASELRCTPPAPLALSGSYTFTVRGGPTGVRARSGEALPADASSTFEVGLMGSLVGVDPPDADRGVRLAEAGSLRPVCAIFSEDLDPASVDAGTLTVDVLSGGKPVRTLPSGAPTLSSFPLPGTTLSRNRVCMVPLPLRQACGQVPQDLPYAGDVAVHLHPARTAAGQVTPAFDWSFSTEPAPTIASVSAANDVVSIPALDAAVDVPVNAVLRVQLSEPAALPAAGVTLTTGGAPAAVNVSVAADGVLLITPAAVLSFGKSYTLDLPAGLPTARGAPVGSGLSLGFTTSAATTALIQPSRGIQTVAETGVAAVVFSRPLQQSSVDGTTITVVSGAQSLPALFGFHPDSPPRSVAVIPVPTWLSGQSVTLTVTTGVRDYRGNPLSAQVSHTFNVEANPVTRRPQSIDSSNLKPKPGMSIDMSGVTVILPGGSQQRNYFLPNSANRTSVTLEATGNGGCAAGPLPIDVLFDVMGGSFTATPTTPPHSGCEYLLTIKQSLLSNLLLESIGPSSDVTGLYTGETKPPAVNQILVDGQLPQATISGWPLFEIDASEPLDPVTFSGALLAADTATCVPGGDTSGCIPAGVTSAGSAVFLRPRSPLMAGTTCTLRLGGPLADLAGNALTTFADQAFTVDSTVPHVLSTVPVANATGVSASSAVQVTFSEPILATSATPTRPGAAGSVTLDTAAGAAPICATVNGTELVVDADMPLTAGATYALHLAGVTDLAGNVCPDTAPLTFTVAP